MTASGETTADLKSEAEKIRSPPHLERPWCLWLQSANSPTYEAGLTPVTRVRTVAEFWDAWDRGIQPAVHHVLDPSQRLVARGGDVMALGLFDATCRPEWEDPRCGTEVRVVSSPLPRESRDGEASPRPQCSILDLSRECALFVVGGACAEARRCAGVRVVRGRGAAGSRCEVWLLADGTVGTEAPDATTVAETLRRTLALRGLHVVTSVKER